MKTNQLHTKLSKCAHIYVRPSLNSRQRMTCARSTLYNERLIIAVNGQKIKQVDKVKLLGVIIYENLTWDDQIKHLENKLLATIIVLINASKSLYPLPNTPKFINHYLFHSLPIQLPDGEEYILLNSKSSSVSKNDA